MYIFLLSNIKFALIKKGFKMYNWTIITYINNI